MLVIYQQKYITGQYCECDKQWCVDPECRDKNEDCEFCSGKGFCHCSDNGNTECRCFDGYEGKHCQCPTEKVACTGDDGMFLMFF